MHGSKRITVAALALVGLSYAISAIMPWTALLDARRGLGAVDQIAQAADRATGQRRILLLGSSPVIIGLSAQEIETATHIPTFNLSAVSAVSFFDDYLAEALPHVRSGDIVVISDPKWLATSSARLSAGCLHGRWRACLAWQVQALPHLSAVMRVMTGVLGENPYFNRRDHRGDLDFDSLHVATNGYIPPLSIAGSPVAAESAAMTRIAQQVRDRGACPVLAFGPILIAPDQQAVWQRAVSALDQRLAAAGLARAVVNDQTLRTNRLEFLDNFEHPTRETRHAWTRRIIDRLTSPDRPPCGAMMIETAQQ